MTWLLVGLLTSVSIAAISGFDQLIAPKTAAFRARNTFWRRVLIASAVATLVFGVAAGWAWVIA